MGLCISKKKKPPTGGAGATSKKKPSKVGDDKAAAAAAKETAQQPKSAAAKKAKAATPDNNAVKAKEAIVTTGGEEKKKRAPQEDGTKQLPVVVIPSAPVRTSSCTKDEVDAILIQCGRLSRSSSGTGQTTSRETGGESGHRRRRSGSKRSYDFDQERKAAAGGDEDGDWESRSVSRPSPQRKRSGSRDRSGGSRRASRSPGRRGEGGVSGGGDRAKQQQPGKMVSVPAREKGRAPSPAAIRCASPRCSSPARMATVGNENACGVVPTAGPTPALSRSSSRKAEQSPYRRNPMTEIDENTLRNNSSSNNGEPQKKFSDSTVSAAHQKATERGKESTGTATCHSVKAMPDIPDDAPVAPSDTGALSAKTNVTRTASLVAERPAAGCRSRRASRDFDQSSNSYASHILEGIQNYHEQHQAAPATPSFSLPACVAKACSILEAVADLNSSSSSSDNNHAYDYAPGRSSADDKGSVTAAPSGADNDSAAARRHAPTAVRDACAAEQAEPQESAGSSSVPAVLRARVSGVQDRMWSAGSSHGAANPMNRRPRQSKQRPAQPEPTGRSRAGSGNGNSSLHRGRSGAHRSSGSSGVRAAS